MRLPFFLNWLFLATLLLLRLGHAGAGTITVFDGVGKSCETPSPESLVFGLTPDEAVASLRNWLHHRPQDLVITAKHLVNQGFDPLYDYRPYLEIAFTGYIKFCSDRDRTTYFSALLDELKRPQNDERAFVLVLLHSRAKLLGEMVLAELDRHPESPTYRAHLEKALRLITYQRKSPEPYPTEKIVRRIEQRLREKEAAK